MGAATASRASALESVVKRADLAMLEAKRQHYMDMQHDRRRRRTMARRPISVAS